MNTSVTITLGAYKITGVEVVSPDPFVIPVSGTQQINVQITAQRWATNSPEEGGGVFQETFLLDPVLAGTTYASDAAGTASVNSSGLITGVAQGSCVITVKAGGITDVIAVTVNNSATVTSVDISPTTATPQVGNVTVVTASPRNAQGQAVLGRTATWNSSVPGVATVGADSGTDPHTAPVTAVAATGSTNVRATVDGIQSPACVVTPVAASTWLFEDTFIGGVRAGAQNGIQWIGTGNNTPERPERVSMVADAGNSSGYAMQFRFYGDGDANWGDDATVEQYFKLPDMPEIYVEWTLYWPLNYKHRKPAPPTQTVTNNKMIRMWDQTYSSTLAQVHIGFSLNSNCPSGSETPPGTYPSNVIIEWAPEEGIPAYPGGPNGTTTGNYGTGPYTGVGQPGTETTYGFYAHVSSGVGVYDGVIKFWVDGVEKYNRTNLNMQKSTTNPGHANVFRNGYLPGWANSGFTQTTDILLRRFRIRATPPF
jgi:hypothetical protein